MLMYQGHLFVTCIPRAGVHLIVLLPSFLPVDLLGAFKLNKISSLLDLDILILQIGRQVI